MDPLVTRHEDSSTSQTVGAGGYVDWLTPPRFAMLLGILIFAAFPQVILGTHSFAYRDFGLFSYPLAHYFRDSFWRGEIPLWNPYNEFGTPFLAQWGTMVLYPPSLIYLLLPLPWSLSLFSLLHLFFGGIGMYVLAVKWTENRLAGGVAGLGFAFSGFALNCLMWPHYTATLAWMPWVIYAVALAWQEGGRRVIWAALAGTLQMLSGTPEIILFTWLIIGGLWICTSLQTWQAAWLSGKRLTIIVVLVTALSAAQLLPFFELLSHSQRDQNFDKGQWPVPSWGWANLFVPMFRVYPTGCGVHFQYNQMFTSSIYAGIFIMFLVFLALLWCRERRVWFFACLAIASLLLSMGERAGVYPILREGFPQIGFMRYASKFVIPMSIAWPIIAAFGLAALLHRTRSPRPAFRTMIAVVLAMALVAAGIAIWARCSPSTLEDWPRTLKSGASRIAILLAIGTLIVVLVRVRNQSRQWLFQCLVLLLLWMDYMSHVPQQNPTLPREALTIEIPRDLSPQPKLGEARAVLSIEARTVFGRAGTSNLTQTFLCLRNGLFANANLVEKIPKADGFYALSIKAARDIEYRLFDTDTEPRAPLARFIGMSHVTAPTNLMRWEARPGHMPMITAGQQPLFANPSDTLDALRATNFFPEKVVYLPPEAKPCISVTHAVPARILSSHVREHCLEAVVDTPAPTVIVIAQAFYPAWQAFVDGSPRPLWRANYAFQALDVPPGHHRIKLVYIDRCYRIGIMVSLFSVAACIVIYPRIRRPGATPSYGSD